jgi:hypothetical protein
MPNQSKIRKGDSTSQMKTCFHGVVSTINQKFDKFEYYPKYALKGQATGKFQSFQYITAIKSRYSIRKKTVYRNFSVTSFLTIGPRAREKDLQTQAKI